MAPARMVGSAEAVARLPGWMISGCATSRVWQAVASATAAASSAAGRTRLALQPRGIACSIKKVVMARCLGSEGEVDARQEIPHRRLREKVGRREVDLARLVQFGVDSLVVRPGGEVAAREREAQCGAGDPPGPLVRGIERHGHLAQFDETAILDVARLRGIERVCDRRRLVRERGLRIVDSLAVQEPAPELLRAVE